MLFDKMNEPVETSSTDSSARSISIEDNRQKKHVVLFAFLSQIAELKNIETTDHLPDYIHQHLIVTQVLKPGESAAHIIELLARYRDEWYEIAEKGMKKGQIWPRYLIPTMKGGEIHAPA